MVSWGQFEFPIRSLLAFARLAIKGMYDFFNVGLSAFPGMKFESTNGE